MVVLERCLRVETRCTEDVKVLIAQRSTYKALYEMGCVSMRLESLWAGQLLAA